MEDSELREKVLEKGKEELDDTGTNDLSEAELRHIAGKLRIKNVSKDFQLQVMRDLDDSGMPIGDFLATMLHGNWNDYGETEKEVENAKEVIRGWSQKYLKARDIEDFMRKIGHSDENIEA